jgi:hypothetical protein
MLIVFRRSDALAGRVGERDDLELCAREPQMTYETLRDENGYTIAALDDEQLWWVVDRRLGDHGIGPFTDVIFVEEGT